jgi:hypothetical protein
MSRYVNPFHNRLMRRKAGELEYARSPIVLIRTTNWND